MRTFTTIACVTAATVIAVAGTATAASASDPSFGVVKSSTASYMLPSYQSKMVHQPFAVNSTVHVRCVIEGEKVDGNANWYRIGVNGRMGFVPVSKVGAVVKVPYC